MNRRILILLLTVCIFSASNNLIAQWIRCGPDNGPVNCLSSIDNKLFAGTDGGVFLSMDTADTWSFPMTEIWCSEVTGFAVMGTNLFNAQQHEGGVYRSVNYGSNWTKCGSGLPSQAIVSLAVLDSWIFAGTQGAGVYRSDNLGDNWIAVNTGLTEDTITSFVVIGDTIFAGTWGEGLFRSSDYGANWIPVTSGLSGDTITALAVLNNILYAGTYAGQVFRSEDNGDSWIPASAGLSKNKVTCFASAGNIIIAGTYDGIYRSSDNGGQWIPADTGVILREARALHAMGDKLFLATIGGIYRSTNKGESWTDVSSGMKNANIRALVMDGTTLYTATWGGGLFLSTDNGSAWTPISDDNPVLPWFKMPGVIHGLAVDDSYIYAGDRRTSVWRRPLSEIITSTYLPSSDVSSGFTLEQNFPNPFSSSTKIRFSVPHKTHVFMKIFDQSGKEVISLLDKEFAPGTYEESFDGKHLSAGVYFYQMQAGEFIQTRKLVLLR